MIPYQELTSISRNTVKQNVFHPNPLNPNTHSPENLNEYSLQKKIAILVSVSWKQEKLTFNRFIFHYSELESQNSIVFVTTNFNCTIFFRKWKFSHQGKNYFLLFQFPSLLHLHYLFIFFAQPEKSVSPLFSNFYFLCIPKENISCFEFFTKLK